MPQAQAAQRRALVQQFQPEQAGQPPRRPVVVADHQPHIQFGVARAPVLHRRHPGGAALGRGGVDQIAQHEQAAGAAGGQQRIDAAKVAHAGPGRHRQALAAEDIALAQVHIGQHQAVLRLPVQRAVGQQPQRRSVGAQPDVDHAASACASRPWATRARRSASDSLDSCWRCDSAYSGKAKGVSRAGVVTTRGRRGSVATSAASRG